MHQSSKLWHLLWTVGAQSAACRRRQPGGERTQTCWGMPVCQRAHHHTPIMAAWLQRARQPAWAQALQQLATWLQPSQQAAYPVFRHPDSFQLLQRAGWASQAQPLGDGSAPGAPCAACVALHAQLQSPAAHACRRKHASPRILTSPAAAAAATCTACAHAFLSASRRLPLLPTCCLVSLPDSLPRTSSPLLARADPGVDPSKGFVRGGYSVAHFSPDRIRNFSIIAHVGAARLPAGCLLLLPLVLQTLHGVLPQMVPPS